MISRSIDEILKTAPRHITGRQLRGARALAGMSRVRLAAQTGLSERTIVSLEHREGEAINCHLETLVVILDALWQAGVQFIDGEGAKLR